MLDYSPKHEYSLEYDSPNQVYDQNYAPDFELKPNLFPGHDKDKDVCNCKVHNACGKGKPRAKSYSKGYSRSHSSGYSKGYGSDYGNYNRGYSRGYKKSFGGGYGGGYDSDYDGLGCSHGYNLDYGSGYKKGCGSFKGDGYIGKIVHDGFTKAKHEVIDDLHHNIKPLKGSHRTFPIRSHGHSYKSRPF